MRHTNAHARSSEVGLRGNEIICLILQVVGQINSHVVLSNIRMLTNKLLGVRSRKMAEGRETRATIDSETVRGLLLINGGGAIALLAFLSGVIQEPRFAVLSLAIILAVFVFQLGLLFAVVHNRLRRLCSLEYAKMSANRKKCTFLGKQLKEPCVCHWSTGFMWASIVAFVFAGLLVLGAGLYVIECQSQEEDSTAAPNKSLKSDVHSGFAYAATA